MAKVHFRNRSLLELHLSLFVPENHPLSLIRDLIDQALTKLNGLFDSICSEGGRESIPPERLLRAQLLQVLYSIRSERQLVEQLHYNLLMRLNSLPRVERTISPRMWRKIIVIKGSLIDNRTTRHPG